jgi:hypothetical protein
MAIVLVLLILWKVPQRQVSNLSDLNSKERFDRVNEARKTLAQIVGGVAVLAGLYSTVQNINVAQKSFALAQEGQITDRFTKAIEQLGAVDSSGTKKLEVRLGGIYALERIANESPTDHWPIMEVLTTYVREHAKRPMLPQTAQGLTAEALAVQVQVTRIPADIQAILSVIGRRNRESEHPGPVLDLHATSLPAADLSQAFLSRADLGGVDFTKAFLIGADLNQAFLSGAYLTGAQLGFANFRGAHLELADLKGANLLGASLNGANLSGADLRNAKNVTQQQIDSATGDTKTQLPDGLRMPEGWKSNP